MLRFVPGPLAVIASSLAIPACNEIPSPTDSPRTQSAASLEVQAGDSQFAIVGHPVPINPTVRAADDSGRPLHGMIVTFEVTSGGGSATGTTSLTDSSGSATVGSWTLPMPLIGSVPGARGPGNWLPKNLMSGMSTR